MAASGNERRMVFDIRGRRKNVVKVVYAVLAVLMGASLFLVVGPVSLGNLLGNSTSGSASKALVEQAEKIERRARKEPNNPDLQLSLTKARISAGNSMAALNPTTGAAEVSTQGRIQLEKASEAWTKYLKATKEPSSGGAQAAAPMLFSLAQTSGSGPEAEDNVKAAAQAQSIVAKRQPSLGSLSTLAIYRLFSFDYAGAKKSEKEAEKYAHSKFERENLSNQLRQIEKRAKEFQKQLAEAAKQAKQAGKGGKSSLTNPLAEGNPLTAP